MKKIICEVYRCSKKEGMYIYVAKEQGVDPLPDGLKLRTGKLELAMMLVLTEEKKLARANAVEVISAIESQGFYLQMPPVLAAEAQTQHRAITEANNFLEK
jgi:uncharacterized protein YcgL (UPF0745 family)